MPEQLWEDDTVQFARLICEIAATQELFASRLCDSMDLDIAHVNELFDRADRVWEEAKERNRQMLERVRTPLDLRLGDVVGIDETIVTITNLQLLATGRVYVAGPTVEGPIWNGEFDNDATVLVVGRREDVTDA